jgi:hypothetical protein
MQADKCRGERDFSWTGGIFPGCRGKWNESCKPVVTGKAFRKAKENIETFRFLEA